MASPPKKFAMQHNLGDRRGMDEAVAGGYGRFGRMFPDQIGIEYNEEALWQLAETMIKKEDPGQFFNLGDEDENPTIPAGYTYFGQFVDHDLTLDQTGIGERESDPGATSNFRTARLDLDSVYGRGPFGSPHLYSNDFTLLTGADITPPKPGPVQTRHDHLRGPADHALIGDPRNDENNIVAQIHTAVIACHNKVMRTASLMAGVHQRWERFQRAAQITRWHYQWVVVHDFLAKVTHKAIYADVMSSGSLPRLRYYNAPSAKYPYMPIEFSGAAYRFGHSMVRPSYALNAVVGVDQEHPMQPGQIQNRRIPIFDAAQSDVHGDLRGFRKIPAAWGIDWGYFLKMPGRMPETQHLGAGALQPSYRIDSLLVRGLAVLPDHMAETERKRSLPFLNLLRGSMMRLPSAEQVASRMSLPTGGVGTFPLLDPVTIWSAGSRFAKPVEDDLTELRDRRAALAPMFKDGLGQNHTPLWYYILREAEWYSTWSADQNDPEGSGKHGGEADIFGGHHLGPMGSTIVLETFMGLMIADTTSILHKPGWRPMVPIADPTKDFGLAELIEWALT